MKINGGKINAWYARANRYINIIRTIMIVSIWLTVTDWSWWYLLALPPMLLLLYYDITVMFGEEINYGIQKSSTWQDMIKKIDEIHERVK